MSTHHIEEIYSVCSQRVSLQICWNSARLVFHLDQSPQGGRALPSIEDSFIDRYHGACDAEDDDAADALPDEILDALFFAGRSTFDQVAPSPTPGDALPTKFHTLLFPEEFVFRFRTLDGEAKLIRNEDSDSHDEASSGPLGHSFRLVIHQDNDLPRFSTKNIQVLEDLFHNGHIARVAVDGKEMCSKAGESKDPESAQRELECLWKITSSSFATAIRVPKLRRLIEISDDQRIVGILEDLIPVSADWELSTLRNIDAVSGITKERRKKWASQVQEAVRLLHQIGVTWGDGKASNVLIHRDTDDAYIIDFGGGWTDGWMTRELTRTVEGDQMAVKSIFDFLQV